MSLSHPLYSLRAMGSQEYSSPGINWIVSCSYSMSSGLQQLNYFLTNSKPQVTILLHKSVKMVNEAAHIPEKIVLDLDLSSILKEQMALQFDDPDGLFSLSPLSSAEDHDEEPSDLLLPPLAASSGRSSQKELPSKPTKADGELIPPAASSSRGEMTLTDAQARRKRKRKEQSHLNRKKMREEERSSLGSQPLPDQVKDRHRERAAPAAIHFDSTQALVAKTGFCRDQQESLNRAVWFGGYEMGWPVHNPSGRQGRQGLGVLAGQPNDPQWAELHAKAADAPESHRNRCVASKKKPNRRGKFKAYGQSQPCNHANDSANAAVLEELHSMKVFQRLAGFSSSVMANWAPDLHSYYVEYLGKLYTHNPSLKGTFKNSSASSIWTGLTYPLVGAASRALGSFDHTKGGHLILWECGLVIEFPAGSTILIPSAIISHSNTTIAPAETRYSFTQYTAGGLFRRFENGFQKSEAHWDSLSDEEKAEEAKKDSVRWAFGISLLRTCN
ncbi:hypothetical protein D9613_003558 [Agrocybe pediades]|uniref:Uncharacterized protein n=1 Tax=Agrocybe pediades TaxID=84607 RepID=A0A8H4VMD1_9AGAR|nr:hypothetical protein D9613_003558 [Agrocybe pediades]